MSDLRDIMSQAYESEMEQAEVKPVEDRTVIPAPSEIMKQAEEVPTKKEQMTPEEFENRIKNDEEFRTEYETQKSLAMEDAKVPEHLREVEEKDIKDIAKDSNPKRLAFSEQKGMPEFAAGNLEAFLSAMEEDLANLEEVKEKAEEKAENSKRVDDMINKDSKFDDVIIDEAEEEKKKEKEKKKTENVAPINLNSIKIKKVKNSKKVYESLKKNNIETVNQVVLPTSGYSVILAGYSSPEITDASVTLGRLDMYSAYDFRYKLLHSKIRGTSLGDLSYEQFLKKTALMEINIPMYGAFMSTYPDKNNFPTKCPNPDCGCDFEFDYMNSKLMTIEDDKREMISNEIMNVVRNKNKAFEIAENAEINNSYRVFLPESKMVVELRHPSLYDHLNDVLANVTDSLSEKYPSTIFLMPYVQSVCVCENPTAKPEDYTFIELETFEDRLDCLALLKEKDDIVLSTEIEEKIISHYGITFSIRDVKCPYCQAKLQDTPIQDITDLLFTIHQHRLS